MADALNAVELKELIASTTMEDDEFAVKLADALLTASADVGASDLHLLPSAEQLKVSWRIDGVLQPVGTIPKEMAEQVVSRLKVLARLLTYQQRIPQEGRIVRSDSDFEVRISTFPTLFGEKVVARNLPRGRKELAKLDDLQLPSLVLSELRAALRKTSGALLIVGPAGSGKTTTAYAALREIIDESSHPRSIVSLEDPVEVVLDGVAQSEVAESVGFDLQTGLRSLVRQDPEVIFLGEIRDAATAGVAFQAALTGQLLVSTFHAGDAAGALSRLTDMGIPPYVLRSSIEAVVAQRLLRRLCTCREPMDPATLSDRLGFAVSQAWQSAGCDKCHQTGYAGRIPVAEAIALSGSSVAGALLEGADANAMRRAAMTAGSEPLLSAAAQLIDQGLTSPAEAFRAWGLDPIDPGVRGQQSL